MIGITNQQYVEAMGASGAIALAADQIKDAAKILDSLPSRYIAMIEAIDGTDMLDRGMVDALHKLADRIALDADIASERGE